MFTIPHTSNRICCILNTARLYIITIFSGLTILLNMCIILSIANVLNMCCVQNIFYISIIFHILVIHFLLNILVIVILVNLFNKKGENAIMAKPKIITVTNEKGGIGKTTTVINMAAVLNREGHKTLVIDTDIQANTTDTYKAKIEGVATLYDVMLERKENRMRLNEAIQHTELGDIVASDKLLEEAEAILTTDPNGMYRLAEVFENADLSEYEYVIMDTNCAINKMLYNCLIASDEVIIPLQAARYSFGGLSDLHRAIQRVQKRQNKDLVIKGLLLTMFTDRHNIKKDAKAQLEVMAKECGTKIFDTYIRSTVTVDEAVACRTSVIDYALNCTASQDYYDFVEEYLKEI